MEKVPTKRLLIISTIVWGVATFIYLLICVLDYGTPSYNEFVNTVLLSAAGEDKHIPADNKEAVKIGKMVKAKYDQGIDPEQLNRLSSEMKPFVDEKLKSLAIQDVSVMFKTLPADLDSAKFIISLSSNNNWYYLIKDNEDRTRLLQVLKREKTGSEAVNSKDFFLLDKYAFILIAQAFGLLIYLINFYGGEAYEGDDPTRTHYAKHVRNHGVWYNLNWKNPLVWVCVLPSSLPFLLIVLLFIKIPGNVSSWNKGKKNTGESYLRDLTGSSEEDTQKLAQKLQTSIGGMHAKRSG